MTPQKNGSKIFKRHISIMCAAISEGIPWCALLTVVLPIKSARAKTSWNSKAKRLKTSCEKKMMAFHASLKIFILSSLRPWKSTKRKLLGFPVSPTMVGPEDESSSEDVVVHVNIYLYIYIYVFRLVFSSYPKKICASPIGSWDPKFRAKIYNVFIHHLVELQAQLLSNLHWT